MTSTGPQRLLVTGVSGLLGSTFASFAAEHFDIWGVYCTYPARIPGCHLVRGDLTRKSVVESVLNAFHPEIIVHCAALTDVDACEQNPEAAWRANVGMTEHLAHWAEAHNCKLVLISTDSVFDGLKGEYSEDDRPEPLNVYATTKLAGETLVRQHCPNHLIVRTNIYGWNMNPKRQSLAEWVLAMLSRGEIITGLRDVFFAPILVNDLADTLLRMLKQQAHGLYHIAGTERISKADFAREVAQVFGLNVELVRDISIDDLYLPAPRPRDTSLDVSKAEAILGYRLPGVRAGLQRLWALRESGYIDSLRVGRRG